MKSICLSVCVGSLVKSICLSVCVGSLVSVYGLMTFTSRRSMEIEVVVDYESLTDTLHRATDDDVTDSDVTGDDVAAVGRRVKAVDAFFTFVAIDSSGKAAPVPPLTVSISLSPSDFTARL